jgi:hypothetical protein
LYPTYPGLNIDFGWKVSFIKEMNNSLIDYFIYKNFVVSESELTKENTNKFSQITKEEELKKTTTKQTQRNEYF